MLVNYYKQNQTAIHFAFLAYTLYTMIMMIFYPKTTIFYNNGQFDVLFQTDTGVIFKGDWFYGIAADLRHFLFRNFMSPFVFPLKVILGPDALQKHPTIYGMYLSQIQIVFMSINTFILIKVLTDYRVKKVAIILIGLITVISWEQILFAVNIERFFFGQFSLLLFLLLVHTKKTESYINSSLAGIVLIGTTITNFYLYLAHILFSKTKWIEKLKHITSFGALFYYVLLFGGGGGAILSFFTFLGNYTGKFTDKYSLVELPVKIFTNLIYPSLFPPEVDTSIKKAFFQSSEVGIIQTVIVIIVLAIITYVIWMKRSDHFIILLAIVLLANITLHGALQFGLRDGALYSVHFNFAILLLLGLFSTLLNNTRQKWVYGLLSTILLFSAFGTVELFINIWKLGIEYYPR